MFELSFAFRWMALHLWVRSTKILGRTLYPCTCSKVASVLRPLAQAQPKVSQSFCLCKLYPRGSLERGSDYRWWRANHHHGVCS